MKRYLILPTLALSALALTGCQANQATIDNINAQIAADLPTICALASTADATFQTIVVSVNTPTKTVIKPNVVQVEQDAMAAVNSICTDPSKVSAATALQTVAKAYAAVVSEVKAAKAAQAASTN